MIKILLKSRCSAQPAVWEGGVGGVGTQAGGDFCHFVQVNQSDTICAGLLLPTFILKRLARNLRNMIKLGAGQLY